MDSKLAPKADSQATQAEPEIPELNPQPQRPASYSMMEPKMRRIYGEFYREIYFSEVKHLDTKTQELISIAASLVAKCQGCIEGHLKKALEAGATEEEISETICIAAAINAAAIIDLTDIAAGNMNINHFPSQGPRFKVEQ
ncbi:MAG TPA: carboxymuconolactone decarboxylase family protein [Blastocatellia bacterium]|jgi:AhpD family alkylhydroperoxidase|nr:carboxymuconolactone decarboxylase family protein [Blastocatellia bacterium]